VKPINLIIIISLYFGSLFSVVVAQDSSQLQETTNTASEEIKQYTNEQALEISQAAIGKTVGHYQFTSATGEKITSRSFLGKPLIISLIYTSCYNICPTILKI